ncbi:FeoB-associated Cys-rich membrane protein [Marinifilum sp. D714]|uniref:FeoB-associated Cys-rich membrane protein n=1 Tax=Marinifilum sp. D714 TaxID=2937523 RepID=UPI0027C938DA|nr:FeoB-associated Cys-rich membrane protein [Marinifilum sp. D714]MDQ2177218.1 FeoB-associated Cys-rich membrane protein [Marinifilum sp. D714]
MSIQLVLTYLIIIYAVGYTFYHLFQLIKKQKESACGGGCSGCNFKNELKSKGIHTISIDKNKKFTYLKN